jgi:hypothetical protein
LKAGQAALIMEKAGRMETVVEYENAAKDQNLSLASCFKFNTHCKCTKKQEHG